MKPTVTALILWAALAALITASESLAVPLAAAPSLADETFGDDARQAGQIGGTPALIPPQSAPPAQARAGNPLWAIPLATLSATLERPLFTPSRRPPLPAVAGAPHMPPPRQPPKPAQPERPPLTLVGTVVGETDGFGLFIDPATKAVVRLKTGDEFQGWILRSVRGREVTLEKNHLMALLALPAPDADLASAPRPTPKPPHDNEARRRSNGGGARPTFTQP